MKLVVRVTIGVAFFLVFGCNTNHSSQKTNSDLEQRQTPIIDFEKILNDPTRILRMSDLVETIEYIRPEYPKSIIGTIFGVRCQDSLLFVNSNKLLLCYSREGKFLRTIGSEGRGPTEYLGILDFAVNQHTIAINSNYIKTIRRYDLDGKHVGDTHYNGYVYNIDLLDDELIALNMGHGAPIKTADPFVVSIVNYHGDTLAVKRVSPEYENGVSSSPVRWLYKDTLCVWNDLNDTIFSVTKDRIEPRYILDFGKYKMPEEKFRNAKMREAEGHRYILFPSFCETQKYLLMTYQYNNKAWVSYFEKETGKIFAWSHEPESITYGIVRKSGLLNDIDGGVPLYLNNQRNDILYTTMTPEQLIGYAASGSMIKNSDNQKQKQLENLIASLDESENPLIILFKLKP